MNEKINFGIDFLQTLAETENLCKKKMKNVIAFGGFLLILEWGFSIQEQVFVTNQVMEKGKKGMLDEPNKTIRRLLDEVSDDKKLLTDIIMLTLLDPNTNETKAKEFVFNLGEALGFQLSEIGELAVKADCLLDAFVQIEKIFPTNL